MTNVRMTDVLAKICADKRDHIARVKRALDLSAAPPVRGFKTALQHKIAAGKPAIIAEIKKASPSKGLLRADFEPARHAAQYQAAGAACLSILTDEPYFQGTDAYLQAGRAACSLPVLRKDFMVDLWQIDESRVLGADAVLLIMAALDDSLAQDMYDSARALGMDVLVETHDETELDRALALDMPDALLGINNRNLKTLEVSLDTARNLIRKIPPAHIAVAESGIHTRADLKSLQNAGFPAFLIGEAFMTQPDPGQALLTFLEEQS